MEYKVDFSREAVTNLRRLDKQVAQRILDRIKWLSFHIEDVNHKALTGHLRGAFKLRVGDYRVVYELKHKASLKQKVKKKPPPAQENLFLDDWVSRITIRFSPTFIMRFNASELFLCSVRNQYLFPLI
jgi:mRNA interferase RelE/StbE